MRKRKEYKRVVFDVPLFESFFDEFQSLVEKPEDTRISSLQVERGTEKWDYESVAEFYSDLRSGCDHADFTIDNGGLRAGVSTYNEA